MYETPGKREPQREPGVPENLESLSDDDLRTLYKKLFRISPRIGRDSRRQLQEAIMDPEGEQRKLTEEDRGEDELDKVRTYRR